MRSDDCAIRPSRAVHSLRVDFYKESFYKNHRITIVGRLLAFFYERACISRNEQLKKDRDCKIGKNVFILISLN